MNVYHVYPVEDLQPHDLDGAPCPCEPVFEREPSGDFLVIHNAFDGRDENVH